MEYRRLLRGHEKINMISLGLGNIHVSDDQTIENTIRYVMENGINFLIYVLAE